MEFPDVGEHCSLSSCNQLDFLPFTCDACKKIYCKDHVKYDEHQCTLGQKKDRRVPVCPLCNQPISISASDVVDRKVNEHIENDCKSDLAKHKRSNKCRVKGCKQHMLVPVLCASCKQNFCLRHRHENDHECGVVQTTSSGNRTMGNSASVRAGQEAAKRYSSNSNVPKKKSSPQTSVLSTVGSDLNRNRIERMQSTGPRSTPATSVAPVRQNTQNNVSDDQALALALHASLNDTTFVPEPAPPPAKQLTRQEREDMELARALQESEKEAREQNRQRDQQNSNKSSSCIIS